MPDIFPSHFFINIPIFILLILGVFAISISYYYYKITVPPVSKKMRMILGSLRALIIIFILLIFFTPEITLIWRKPVKQNVIFAIDRSASMGITEGGIQRIQMAKMVAEDLKQFLASRYSISTYAFDIDTTQIEIDSIKAGKLETDIDYSLTKIVQSGKETDAIILFTDGIITRGQNPLFSNILKKTKIYTIGFGDSTEKPDILITGTESNKIVYKDKPTEIKVNVTIRGIEQNKSVITIGRKNKIIAARNITLESAEGIHTYDFEIIPDELGVVAYDIEVASIDSEKLLENNQSTITMEVLKSKLKVALFASRPSYDVKFLKKLISDMEDIELLTIVDRDRSHTFSHHSKITYDSIDVIIFHDYPGKNSLPENITSLKSASDKRQIPFLQILSGRENVNKYEFVYKRFPDLKLNLNSNSYILQVEPSITGMLNILLNVYDSEEKNREFWEKCAPIEYSFDKVEVGNQNKILLATKMAEGNVMQVKPVMMINTLPGANNILFLGEGFWRWHFLMAEDRQYKEGWSLVLHNIIRWLASSTTGQNISFTKYDKIIKLGDSSILTVQVYDGSYNPVNDGMVLLEVSGPAGKFESEAENLGNGIYKWIFTPFEQGLYSVNATAWRNDVILGETALDISVIPINTEFIYTRQENNFLRQLSSFTGGKYFTIENYKSLPERIPYYKQTVQKSKKYDLWNKATILLFIIVLLTMEWFLRKRRGLA